MVRQFQELFGNLTDLTTEQFTPNISQGAMQFTRGELTTICSPIYVGMGTPSILRAKNTMVRLNLQRYKHMFTLALDCGVILFLWLSAYVYIAGKKLAMLL